MIVERRSVLTGKLRRREIPVTQEQIDRWQEGELIQFAMPHLSPSERDFVKLGITDDEWAVLSHD